MLFAAGREPIEVFVFEVAAAAAFTFMESPLLGADRILDPQLRQDPSHSIESILMDNPSLSTEETPSTETAKPKRPTRGKTRSLDDRISMREAELVELRKQKALRTVSKDPSRKKIVTSIKHLRFAAERLSDKKLKAICFQAAEDLESAINGQLVLE